MIRKMLRHTIDIVCGAVLAVVIAVLVLYILGIRPYVVMSGSMEPSIHTGSVCFVNTRVDYDKVEPGDVIAFQTAIGTMVTHRVVAVTGEGMETKGDANDVSDGVSTTPVNFSGKTLFSIPYLGQVIIFFRKLIR